MRPQYASVAALIAVIGWASPLHAQTMDHTQLEQLFGEPVTTSATGKPQRVTDAPVDIQIITADQIHRAAATDIPGILAELSDVEVSRPTMGQADVTIHGYNQPYSPRLLVLIDGRQVYLDHFGMTAWSSLPVQLDEIKQIEVVKGPNTALYGFNAVSGVINIVTVNPLYDRVNRASAAVGTQLYRDGSAVTTIKSGDTGLRLSAGASAAHEFSDGASPADQAFRDTDLTRRAVSGDLVSQITAGSQLRASASWSGVNETDFLPFPSLATVDTKTYSGRLSYLADTAIGKIEATAYHNGMEARLFSASTPDVPLNNQVTVAKLDDLFKVDAQDTVRLGVEYRRNTLASTPSVSGEVGYDVYSANAMWDKAITEAVSWTNAARLDYLVMFRNGPLPAASPFTNDSWDRSLTGVSYNSGIVYKPTDVDTVRLSTGRGLQAPSLVDVGFMQTGPVLMTGNPNLQPTVVTDYQLGYARQVARLASTAQIGLFYQQNHNLLALPGSVPDSGAVAWFHNIGDSDIRGLDLGVKGGDGPWRWDFNYTYQLTSDDFSGNVTALQIPVNYGRSTPRHLGNLHLGYTVGRWDLDGYARFRSGYVTELLVDPAIAQRVAVDVPSHVDLSARIGYHITDWLEAALLGSSIDSARYRDSSGLEVERRVVFRLGVIY